MESSGTGGIARDLLKQAFSEAHQGFSVDRVIADPDLNLSFQAACNTLGVPGTSSSRNRELMNRRKRGGMQVETSERTSFDDEEYRFAAEIAIRIIERRDQLTLDDILCDPEKANEFDRFAAELAPGFSSVQYRWAALALRKSRNLQPEVAARLLRPEDANLVPLRDLVPADLSTGPGVYMFLDIDSKTTLYVGEASNLRGRLSTHVDHSDNKHLARHLWDNGVESVLVEYYVLPAETSKRELRVIELEQIRGRKPPFNVAGTEP